MREGPGKIVTHRVECPACGATVTYREQRGLKRFRPRAKRCRDCGEVWR